MGSIGWKARWKAGSVSWDKTAGSSLFSVGGAGLQRITSSVMYALGPQRSDQKPQCIADN